MTTTAQMPIALYNVSKDFLPYAWHRTEQARAELAAQLAAWEAAERERCAGVLDGTLDPRLKMPQEPDSNTGTALDFVDWVRALGDGAEYDDAVVLLDWLRKGGAQRYVFNPTPIGQLSPRLDTRDEVRFGPIRHTIEAFEEMARAKLRQIVLARVAGAMR